jgi:hypothetical protein
MLLLTEIITVINIIREEANYCQKVIMAFKDIFSVCF